MRNDSIRFLALVSEAYIKKALDKNTGVHSEVALAKILSKKGISLYRLGNNLEALEAFNASILACRLAENYRTMGVSYSMMGSIFRINGLYDRAIEYIIKSKLNYEKAGFVEGSAWVSYLLGRIYADLKLHQKALIYFQEALRIYSQMANAF